MRSFSRLMTGDGFDPRARCPTSIAADARRVRRRARPAVSSSFARGHPVRSWCHRRHAGSRVARLAGHGDNCRGSPGDAPASKQTAPRIAYFDIGPGYFAAMRAAVLAGREFSEHDNSASPPVAMVNESLAKRLWPSGGVVGKPVVLNGKEYEVVGVVGDSRIRPRSEVSPSMAYVAFWQNSVQPQIDARIVVRVEGDPSRALLPLRHAVASVDPAVPVTETLVMESQMRATFTEVRLGGSVLAVGAILALFLSAIGLYGVVSFLVAQRAKEVGIRIAVGARASEVSAMLLRQGLRPVLVGGAIGIVISAIGSRFLTRWLFGIAPFDPMTVAIATAAVGIVSIIASYIPRGLPLERIGFRFSLR